jgi:SAM-dependent methyltransferase
VALPAELGRERTDRLTPVPTVSAVPPPPRSLQRRLADRLASRGKHEARRLIARGVRPVIQPNVEATDHALHRIAQLEQQIQALQTRRIEEETIRLETHAATVNLELLKGQVLSVVEQIEGLGMAIAPATGLEGAGVRLAELRERVNGLDRRLRTLASDVARPAPVAPAAGPATAGASAGGTPAAPAAPAAPAVSSAEPSSASFDYVGFERRFRGDPAAVLASLEKRYADVLADNPPVVDLGCGRAELVGLLAARGVQAIGVDTDPSMVAEARDQGLDVRLMDGLAFLESQERGSLGAIICTHLVEHLELDALIKLLELAVTRLKPGGVFIAETPNPASLIVLGNSYILDPTHVRPLHPSLLSFLCEGAGFRDVRLAFYEPARDYHLPLIQGPDAPAWAETVNAAFGKLNDVLFGAQEYSVTATAPS